MQLEPQRNKDFWAGLMFIAIGATAMIISRDYRFGSALNMGPGFFPVMLGGILIVFGISIMALGLRSKEKIKARVSIRAMIQLPVSVVLFGVLIERVGFVPALAALIFLSAASGKEFKFTEVFFLAAVLILASVGVFVWTLGMPFPLFKWF